MQIWIYYYGKLYNSTKYEEIPMKDKKINIRQWTCIAAGLVIVLIILFVVIRQMSLGQTDQNVGAGVAHLKELEARDVTAIEQTIKQQKKAAMAANLEQELQEGTVSVWSLFNDSVIFGDSRSVGFYSYGLLDESRVYAASGLTIANMKDYEDKIKTMNPSYLFLCTGINDVSIGFWPTPEDYVTAYEEMMQRLMELLPDTEIFVNSIFPAQDPAFNKSEKWRQIPDYNEAVKAWCAEKGYHYIDNTAVFEAHKDLYQADGIHFQKELYEYWATNMIIEAIRQ